MVFLGWKFALFHPRHLSLCTPYLYTLLAWGGIVLVEPDNFPSLEVVIALFIAISAAFGLRFVYTEAKSGIAFRSLIEHLQTQARPGDALVMNMIAGIGFMRSYYRGPDIRFYFTQEEILPSERLPDKSKVIADLEEIISETSRTWLVLYGGTYAESSRFVKDWLDRRVLLLSANWYDNHLVCLYDNSEPIYR